MYLCAIQRKQAFYATSKAREKRHGHLPCDAREGIKNLSLRFLSLPTKGIYIRDGRKVLVGK